MPFQSGAVFVCACNLPEMEICSLSMPYARVDSTIIHKAAFHCSVSHGPITGHFPTLQAMAVMFSTNSLLFAGQFGPKEAKSSFTCVLFLSRSLYAHEYVRITFNAHQLPYEQLRLTTKDLIQRR